MHDAGAPPKLPAGHAVVLCAAVVLTACGANSADVPPDLLDAIEKQGGGGAYPEGPYGTAAGDVMPDLCFDGWTDPAAADYSAAAFETICFRDFHDDPGARLLLVNSSALWCLACKAEYGGGAGRPSLSERLSERRSRGFRVLGTLFEDNRASPPTPEQAATWARAYDVDFPFALDGAYALGRTNVAPTNRLVDTRTMEIVFSSDGDEPAVLFSFVDDYLAGEAR